MRFLDKKHSNCLRGMAILMVLVCHTIAELFPSSIARYATPLGGIGVAVFLMLSGYGLSFTCQNNLDGFWRKRCISTFLPYTLIFILIIPMKQYTSVFQFLGDYLTVKPVITFYWYIGYLAVWYAIFWLMKKFVRDSVVNIALLTMMCCAMLLCLDSLQAEQTFSFLIGCLLFRYRDRAERLLTQTFVPVLCAGVGLAFLVLKQTPYIRNAYAPVFNIVQLMIKVPLALFVITAVYALIRLNIVRVILDKAGKYSYDLYLVHSVTILLFSALTMNKYIVLLLFIGSTILASVVFHKLLQCIRNSIPEVKRGSCQ